MQKAIYLNVLVGVDSTVAGQQISQDTIIGDIRQALAASTRAVPLRSGPDTISLYEVKRVRPEKGPATVQGGNFVRLLLYIEGEQAAPQNFQELATKELNKVLASASQHLVARGWTTQVHTIEENTNAVDELAEEEEAAATEHDTSREEDNQASL